MGQRHTDGQNAHENSLNLSNYWRTANQNYNEVSSHACQNDHHQKNLQTINAGGGVVKKGSLLLDYVYCCWECTLVRPLWRTVWRFLEKLNIELSYDSEIPLSIYPEKTII